MKPEDLVAAAAQDFDSEGLLVEPALRRLAWRKARSGRTCERCQRHKPLSAFSRDSRNPDGLRRYCRSCDAERYRARKGLDSA